MNPIHRLLSVACCLLPVAFLFAATPPALVNYQGVLRDAAGAPRNGSFDMVFRFYGASSAGTLLLTDTHNAAAPSGQVVVANGLFAAQLGAGTIAAGSEPNLAEMFRDNAAVWLEVQVGAETLTPRVRVLASAYAQNADALDGLDASTFLTAESDPQVGVLSATKWCRADATGATLLCTADAPNDGDWTTAASNLYSSVSGNVGIGTSSPAAKLHVSAPAAPELRVDNPTWAIGERALLTFMHGTRYAGISSYLPGGSDVDLQFTTTNANTPATTMVLTGNGDLGIGTTAPAGRLEVAEHECVQDQSMTTDNVLAPETQFWQSFKPAVSGYLCKIMVGYTGDPATDSYGIEVLTGVGRAGTRLFYQDGLEVGSDDYTVFTFPSPIYLTAEQDYTFCILHSGYTPAVQFNSNSASYPRGTTGYFNCDLVFTTYMSVMAQSVPTLFAHEGQVGIGTANPSSRLTVDGDVEVSGSRLHVGTDGLVGIGTAAPANRLDVEGGSAIGAAYAGSAAAPANGLIVEGRVGIGTAAPASLPLTVQGSGTASQLIQLKDSSGANQWHLNLQGAGLNLAESGVADYRLFVEEGGNVGIGTGSPGYQLQLSTDSAAKLTTMAWAVYSDARLKRDIRPFTDGLEMLARVRPVRYRLNGLGGLPAGHEGIGVIAQEMREIAPYTVGTTRMRLHPGDAADTEVYDFNGSALVFALINAVQELDERTKGLTDRESAVPPARELDAEPRLIEGRESLPAGAEGPAAGPRKNGPAVLWEVSSCVAAGEVLVLIPNNGAALHPCFTPADPMVVGVALAEAADGRAPVATSGLALVKADATVHPIAKGDLLVTSGNPGHAMRMTAFVPGTVIGKAMEDLPAGTGLIRVLVMLK